MQSCEYLNTTIVYAVFKMTKRTETAHATMPKRLPIEKLVWPPYAKSSHKAPGLDPYALDTSKTGREKLPFGGDGGASQSISDRTSGST